MIQIFEIVKPEVRQKYSNDTDISNRQIQDTKKQLPTYPRYLVFRNQELRLRLILMSHEMRHGHNISLFMTESESGSSSRSYAGCIVTSHISIQPCSAVPDLSCHLPSLCYGLNMGRLDISCFTDSPRGVFHLFCTTQVGLIAVLSPP